MKGLGHGQVWWADVDKVRPVVILTRRRVASQLHSVLIAPITTTARGIATEVPLGTAEGVIEGSVANLDNTQLLAVNLLLRQAGEINAERWPEVCHAMSKVMAC